MSLIHFENSQTNNSFKSKFINNINYREIFSNNYNDYKKIVNFYYNVQFSIRKRETFHS